MCGNKTFRKLVVWGGGGGGAYNDFIQKKHIFVLTNGGFVRPVPFKSLEAKMHLISSRNAVFLYFPPLASTIFWPKPVLTVPCHSTVPLTRLAVGQVQLCGFILLGIILSYWMIHTSSVSFLLIM